MLKNYFDNVLIAGSGPVGVNLYINFNKGYAEKVGLKIRNSKNSELFLKNLKSNNNLIESTVSVNEINSISGKCLLENLYINSEELINEWDVLILCTPCDAYLSVLKDLNLKKLTRIKKIVLISPEFGSSLILKSFLKNDKTIEFISFSNYFGASNFSDDNHCLVITNALKKNIYIGSTHENSLFVRKIADFLGEFKINSICCKNQLEAESKNITLFVHSPFLLNKVSLDQVFDIDKTKRFLYKLYPEGPITMTVIHKMINLYQEILELYSAVNLPEFNLLKFLNDSYPVPENSISKNDIEDYLGFPQLKKEYLLYVRYASILIDPFSTPDEDGRYFDFSRVSYSRIYKDKENLWNIPRRPLEDYNKLNLIWHLTKLYGTRSDQIFELIKIYKDYYFNFIKIVGEKNIKESCKLTARNYDAEIIYSSLK